MPASMKLIEFSDDELVLVLDDVANGEGWATSAEVAEEIGITHEHPTNCVGGRFAYLKRIGILENERKDGETYWRLTEKGEALTHPKKLPAAAERALDGMDEGQRIAATNRIAGAVQSSSPQARQLSRRAWRHHTATAA